MNKKHNHGHIHCQHANLKFCQTCQVPHCLDCGKEWSNYSYAYYSQPYTYGSSFPLSSAGSQTLGNNSSIYKSLGASEIKCSHE